MIGEYPERVGQPECQYYLKTGTCKFGITCKFNHPREKAGIAGRVALNVLGYPLRPVGLLFALLLAKFIYQTSI
nr:zinc finger CCCH domain-containing protein ZFN-like isoform X1 [Ipomoea batatas]